jgi:hypothetical protein
MYRGMQRYRQPGLHPIHGYTVASEAYSVGGKQTYTNPFIDTLLLRHEEKSSRRTDRKIDVNTQAYTHKHAKTYTHTCTSITYTRINLQM